MNTELIEKLQACSTAEELVALAKAEGEELTLEQAQLALSKLNGPLTDEELDAVSAGGIWDRLKAFVESGIVATRSMVEQVDKLLN